MRYKKKFNRLILCSSLGISILSMAQPQIKFYVSGAFVSSTCPVKDPQLNNEAALEFEACDATRAIYATPLKDPLLSKTATPALSSEVAQQVNYGLDAVSTPALLIPIEGASDFRAPIQLTARYR